MKDNEKIVFVTLLVVFILFVFYGNPKSENVTSENVSEYLSPTEDFVTTNPELVSLAATLKGNTEKETVKNTLEYVHKNIEYEGDVGIGYCFTETAYDVYATKSGDCVSMTRLTVTLLRINGIPSRSLGGCVKDTTPCTPLFAVGLVNEIPTSNILDNKKRGMLHEWAEAYVDGQWILLETTANRIIGMTCQNYVPLQYDSNPIDRCIISNSSFIERCRVW